MIVNIQYRYNGNLKLFFNYINYILSNQLYYYILNIHYRKDEYVLINFEIVKQLNFAIDDILA